MDHLDKQDWTAFCRGDREAMVRIYNRHKDLLYGFGLYVTGNRQISEDLVADTFVRLMEQKSRLVIEKDLKNWLFICLRNLAYNFLKKDGGKISVSALSETSAVDDNIDMKIFIEKILNNLAKEERELILLREQQGFSITEIAEILNISEEAVRTRLYRVRKKMQHWGKERK
ncbi:MAG: RNA polymerase sigma factor [candidate division Zixibacteria bacterium]|nr:RNA polymerase sigma factor [candidate division Zixibacteria bacterium]